jgi:hypothetical protein
MEGGFDMSLDEPSRRDHKVKVASMFNHLLG